MNLKTAFKGLEGAEAGTFVIYDNGFQWSDPTHIDTRRARYDSVPSYYLLQDFGLRLIPTAHNLEC